MPRKPRFFLPDVPVHVVKRGNNRQAVFFGDSDYRYRANALGVFDPVVRPHGLYLALGEDDTQRRDAYRGLFREHIDGQDLEGIRACLQTGTPLGNDRFRTQIEQALNVKVGQSRRGRPKKPKDRKIGL